MLLWHVGSKHAPRIYLRVQHRDLSTASAARQEISSPDSSLRTLIRSYIDATGDASAPPFVTGEQSSKVERNNEKPRINISDEQKPYDKTRIEKAKRYRQFADENLEALALSKDESARIARITNASRNDAISKLERNADVTRRAIRRSIDTYRVQARELRDELVVFRQPGMEEKLRTIKELLHTPELAASQAEEDALDLNQSIRFLGVWSSLFTGATDVRFRDIRRSLINHGVITSRPNAFILYTDGSILRTGAGAAAVAPYQVCLKMRFQKLNVRLPSVEREGIVLALELAAKYAQANQNIIIFTDHLANTTYTTRGWLEDPDQRLRRIDSTCDSLRQLDERGCRVELHWLGKSGTVLGAQLAHTAARRAAALREEPYELEATETTHRDDIIAAALASARSLSSASEIG